MSLFQYTARSYRVESIESLSSLSASLLGYCADLDPVATGGSPVQVYQFWPRLLGRLQMYFQLGLWLHRGELMCKIQQIQAVLCCLVCCSTICKMAIVGRLVLISAFLYRT
jgi:hypothetical protein